MGFDDKRNNNPRYVSFSGEFGVVVKCVCS